MTPEQIDAALALTARPRAADLAVGDVLIWTGSGRVMSDRVKVIARRKETDDGWWATDGSGLADFVWNRSAEWDRLDDLIHALRTGWPEALHAIQRVLALDVETLAEAIYCGDYPDGTWTIGNGLSVMEAYRKRARSALAAVRATTGGTDEG